MANQLTLGQSSVSREDPFIEYPALKSDHVTWKIWFLGNVEKYNIKPRVISVIALAVIGAVGLSFLPQTEMFVSARSVLVLVGKLSTGIQAIFTVFNLCVFPRFFPADYTETHLACECNSPHWVFLAHARNPKDLGKQVKVDDYRSWTPLDVAKERASIYSSNHTAEFMRPNPSFADIDAKIEKSKVIVALLQRFSRTAIGAAAAS